MKPPCMNPNHECDSGCISTHLHQCMLASCVQELTKKQKDQQEAVWELLHTEVEFIRRLKVIIDVSVVLHCVTVNSFSDTIPSRYFFRVTF